MELALAWVYSKKDTWMLNRPVVYSEKQDDNRKIKLLFMKRTENYLLKLLNSYSFYHSYFFHFLFYMKKSSLEVQQMEWEPLQVVLAVSGYFHPNKTTDVCIVSIKWHH